jgi:hypothetical protein
MPKTKRKLKNQTKKEKGDFAQTAFSVFQKATGAKPNLRQADAGRSRSGRGK